MACSSPQSSQSFHCMYLQNMEVDLGWDQNEASLDSYVCYFELKKKML